MPVLLLLNVFSMPIETINATNKINNQKIIMNEIRNEIGWDKITFIGTIKRHLLFSLCFIFYSFVVRYQPEQLPNITNDNNASNKMVLINYSNYLLFDSE